MKNWKSNQNQWGLLEFEKLDFRINKNKKKIRKNYSEDILLKIKDKREENFLNYLYMIFIIKSFS